MRKLALIALTLAAPLSAQAPRATAFVDVNVLPMDRERVLEHQTVVVVDGRIAEVGPAATVRVPEGAQRVDGRGKWLLPGLAEMHAHIPGAQASAQTIEDIFTLYVANGVTTIRGMLGAPNQLELQRRTASGELLGPTIYVGAPSLNGNSAPDAATGAALVRAHRDAGYDFLKIHPGLSREAYDAIAATAREVGLTWAGHVPQDVGLRHALASGQSTIDHLDGYLQELVPAELAAQQTPMGQRLLSLDESRIPELARATAQAGVWTVPTMALWENLVGTATPESYASMPELRYASRQWIDGWTNQKRNMLAQNAQNGVGPEAAAEHIGMRRRLLRALVEAGAPLLLGTDSPQLFSVPGFSLHREVDVMIASGLTPWQVLQAGTANVARYAHEELGEPRDFGTIAPGMRADLVLLDANPLADITALRRRAGVMVRGRWLPAAELDRLLEAMAARHATT